MVKQLTKHGNSRALIIDKPILELLGIEDDTQLNITTDGQSIIISPVVDTKRAKRFETALARVNKRYGKALKRLAE